FVWPVQGEITVPYSVTALIYNQKMGDWRTSESVSIASELGTQVMAVSAGIVESVSMDDLGGMTVVIQHSGGLRSVYSNLASMPTVYEGDNVMTGEVIGSVGVTASGETKDKPHLCFSMTLDGISVNPSEYLP
ncbi:MAG: M23 family metallopeptidase, partial [Clostridiales bacterium]|nr:M23 family metallopeptidase [Clostridiales bacterium]